MSSTCEPPQQLAALRSTTAPAFLCVHTWRSSIGGWSSRKTRLTSGKEPTTVDQQKRVELRPRLMRLNSLGRRASHLQPRKDAKCQQTRLAADILAASYERGKLRNETSVLQSRAALPSMAVRLKRYLYFALAADIVAGS